MIYTVSLLLALFASGYAVFDRTSEPQKPHFFSSQGAHFAGAQPVYEGQRSEVKSSFLKPRAASHGLHRSAGLASPSLAANPHRHHRSAPFTETRQSCKEKFAALDASLKEDYTFTKFNNALVDLLDTNNCPNMSKDLKLALTVRMMLYRRRDPKETLSIFMDLNRPLVQDSALYESLSKPPLVYPKFLEAHRQRITKQMIKNAILDYYADIFSKANVLIISECVISHFMKKPLDAKCKSIDVERYVRDVQRLH